MATDIGELLVKLSADLKNLDSGLKTAKGELAGFQNYASSFAASLKKTLAFAGVAVGLWEIASAVKAFATDAASVGARTETLAVSMYQVGKNAGVSAQSLDTLIAKLQQLGITRQEAMLGATKFMAAGLDLSKLSELATRARDIAVVANVNTSEAFSRIIQGVISGESETLKRLMINVGNLDELMKKWSATLGVTKEEIGTVTKANLMLSEVLEKTARFAGAASAADETVGKQLASMARYAEEAKNALWPIFQPAFLAFVREMTAGWKDLEKWARANTVRLEEWGKGFAEWVKWLATGIRDIGAFISENKKLIATFLELYVASKAAGWIAGMGASLKTTAVEVGILAALLGKLKVLVGGPWRILITVALFGLYEAWNKIQQLRQQAGFTPQPGVVSGAIQEGRARDRVREGKELDIAGAEAAQEAQRRGISTEKYLELAKEEQKRAIEGRYKKYTAPSVLPAVLPEHETPEERLAREAKAARERAEAEQYTGAPKDKKGGGKGAKELNEDLLRYLTEYLEAKRRLSLKDAEESYATFKAEQDKKKAELDRDLAEGKITGQEYQQALVKMAEAETGAALKLIDAKIAKEKEAYDWAQKELKTRAETGEISPEALDLSSKKLQAEHAARLKELEGEAGRDKIKLQKELVDLLKKEYENRKQIEDTLAAGREDAALGPIAEKEAEINRLLRERLKLREELINKGATEGQVAGFDQTTKELEINKRFGDQMKGYANLVTGFFGDLTDALMSGETHFRQTFQNFFKSLFKQSIEPAIKQLTQWLTEAFKNMFGTLGAGIANALMGVIGLVGMFLSSDRKSSFTSSGVQSNVTGHEAVRGIIAGETSIPIAQVSESLSEAVAPHLSILRQIEANTRSSGGGGAGQVNINIQGIQATIREAMEAYFREYLLMGAR
jgi:hypothetical protein